ncbi:hypothetical protein EG327_006801 [Venturia inaequalis]|uniref:arginine--tRNA ligase n=1 Tax=Venturia inaequalis TaxID=5025 RepID=A0A8H3VUF4_VENIN|nr:hypothetical protein EG327_006801 [Venturia inaequalis]
MTTRTVSSLEELIGTLGAKIPIPSYPAADVLVRPLDIGRSYLADILSGIIEGDTSRAFSCIGLPNNLDPGDLVVILPKLSHGSVADTLAKAIIEKFDRECPLFRLPFADGVHLRVPFSPQTLTRLFLPYINDRHDTYGLDVSSGILDPASSELGRKKIVVEFSSPNIANEFEGKHLRSTIIGAFIANIHESMGWDVVRINYLGDWGKPMGLLGAGWERFGSEELFEADPVSHLLDVYHKTNEQFAPEVKASKDLRDTGGNTAELESQGLFGERNAFFKRMEEGDEKALALWKRLRDVSIDNLTELYARLNISFDDYSGESQVTPETMAEVEEILKSKGISEIIEDAWSIKFENHQAKKLGLGIVRDREGSSTYLLRDLAAVLERSRKYSFDKMIYVVAGDHNTHFQRVSKILELMDMEHLASKLQHVYFSKTSQMKEKLGTDHPTLGIILDRCHSAFEESLEKEPEKMVVVEGTKDTVAALAATALLTQELSVRRASDHTFDLSNLTTFSPGTGLALSYWVAKLARSLATSQCPAELFEEDLASFAQHPEDGNLLRLLIQYPEVAHQAFVTLEPATVMAYLLGVTTQLEVCFDERKDGTAPAAAQSSLYNAARIVLERAMKLVGIDPVTPNLSIAAGRLVLKLA